MTLAFHYYITLMTFGFLFNIENIFLLIFRTTVPVFGHKIIAVFHSILILYTVFFVYTYMYNGNKTT